MRVADAIWTATALLHQEDPEAEDFEVQEIVSRAVQEKLVGGFRPGLQAHASGHCVANKKPNGGRYRMLYETDRGRRRLLRLGDSSHPDRNGEIRPDKSELPAEYRALVDWYDAVYSKRTPASPSAPVVSDTEPAVQERAAYAKMSSPSSEMQSGTAFVSSAGGFVIPHQLRKEMGIQEGTCLAIYREQDHLVLQPITKEFIHSLVGCCKGEDSLVGAREREHRMEK
jgi:bifunctional DNA-binding transcriptional regulator/antitoxin component of YhaV-PrlF toxin-antitoxin module